MGPASLQPLRHRSFALSLTSSFVSSIGGWMQTVAMGVYIQSTTHNAAWLGLITLAAWTPAIVASPLGGVLADRYPRQRLIQINNVVMALCATVLMVAVLLGRLSPWLAVAMAFLEGFSSQTSWSSWNSLLRDLVEPEDVVAAVSLSSAQFNLGRIIGPVFAGLLLAAGSPAWCFGFNAASFAFVVIVFTFVRSRPRDVVATRASVWRETVEGAREAWRTPGSRNAIIAVGVVAMTASPFITLIPTMAIEIYHRKALGTSALVTAQGVGAVLAAFVLPSVSRATSRAAVVRGSLVCLALSLVAYGLAPNLVLATAAMVVVGASYLGALTQFNTSVQLTAPAHARSRILALYTMSLSLAYPVGAVVQSALVKPLGLRPVTWGSALVLGAVVATTLVARPHFLRALGDPA